MHHGGPPLLPTDRRSSPVPTADVPRVRDHRYRCSVRPVGDSSVRRIVVTGIAIDTHHEPPDDERPRAAHVMAPSRAPARARPAWRRYAISFVVWTLAGIVLAEQSRTLGAVVGDYPRFLLSMLSGMWLWAMFTPLIMDLGQRWPLEHGTWLRNLPKHALVTLVFSAIDALVMLPIRIALDQPLGHTFSEQFQRGLFACEASYVIIIALGMSSRYASLYHERRAAAAELEAELSLARLATLNAQLRPHFLFNTLNAIAELLHTDPVRADRLLLSLAVLLRRSFVAGERQEVALSEELRFVEEYLAILGARLDDRLRVVIDVADDLRDAMVPSFLLQPLVENAIRHGIERVPGGGRLMIQARREGTDRLRIEVSDDGVGLHPALLPRPGSGLGVPTTRERLRHLYGDAQTFELVDAVPRGTMAIVTMPLRRVEPSDAAQAPSLRAEEVA